MSQKEGMGNREYKDSTFRKLYHDKNRASELYNGLTGRTASPDEIEFSFVGGVFTRKLNHDVAFQVGQRMIVVLEHQSTPNENTPVRMLIYVAKIYERYLKKQVGRAKSPTPISNGGLTLTPPGYFSGSARGGFRSTIVADSLPWRLC